MSDWEDQLQSILGDPAQMARITDLAKTLMGGEGETEAAPGPDLGQLAQSLLGGGEAPGPETALLGKLGRLFATEQSRGSDKRALLEAMKPYLSEKRRTKMERAMRMARMAKLAELAMEELNEGEEHV